MYCLVLIKIKPILKYNQCVFLPFLFNLFEDFSVCIKKKKNSRICFHAYSYYDMNIKIYYDQ